MLYPCIYIYIYIVIHICTYVYIYIYISMYVYICIYIYIYVCIHICRYIYIYTCIRVYIYIVHTLFHILYTCVMCTCVYHFSGLVIKKNSLVGGLECVYFFHILAVVIDFHIFQRGRYTTNQLLNP